MITTWLLVQQHETFDDNLRTRCRIFLIQLVCVLCSRDEPVTLTFLNLFLMDLDDENPGKLCLSLRIFCI